MQARLILAIGVSCLVGLGIPGCSKSETPPPPSTNAAAPAKASGGVTDTARQVVQGAQDTAQKVVDQPKAVAQDAQQKVGEAAAKVSQEADTMLSGAKKLLAEKKVQDSSGLLDKVSGMALNADQKQSLGGLKTEVSQTLSDIDKGFSDLKGLIGEKKYSEAATKVVKLKDYQLSPTQQTVYDGLKAQLQKALGNQAVDEGKKAIGTQATDEAKKAIGGLLPGK